MSQSTINKIAIASLVMNIVIGFFVIQSVITNHNHGKSIYRIFKILNGEPIDYEDY